MTSFMTARGLQIKRQDQILKEMLADAKAQFREVNEEIDASPDGTLGVYFNINASQIADAWLAIQEVYDSQNPSANEGKNLDDNGALSNIERLDPAQTKVFAALNGVVGTKIPKDFVLKCTTNNELFINDEAFELQAINCIKFTAKINDNVIPGKVYTLFINGKETTYTAKDKEKPIDVCSGLVQAFNLFNYEIKQDENFYTVISKDFSTFNPSIDVNQTMISVDNLSLFNSVNYAPIICPPETLNVIPSPIQGLISATNKQQPKVLGRLVESDAEYRLRRSKSGSIIGQNVTLALIAKLQDLRGVSSADVIVNHKNVESPEGIPSKAFQTVVEGGDENDIAKTIWLNKPTGIEPYGSIKVPVLISTDQWFDIYFSRPLNVPIIVKIECITYDEFPKNGELLIKESVVKYGNSLGINREIIDQRFFGSIFANCPGLLNLKIKIARKNNLIYSNKILIGRTEYATFDSNDVVVIKNV